MKKILLATSALGFFAAGAAHAEGPVVTLGGYADVQVGSGKQESLYKDQSATGAVNGNGQNSIFARELHTKTDTIITLKVDGKADNGLGYGAYIELNADTSANDTTLADNPARRTYLYVESGFGRVEAGATGDAGNALKVDASTFARATGGIAGDFYKYVDLAGSQSASGVPNTTGINNGAQYYILPGLPTAVGLPGEANFGYNATTGALKLDTHDDRANANKISYYTPRIQGLQAGVSFTPDQSEHGTANGFASSSANATSFLASTGFLNVWNGGLNYQTQYDAFAINAAITGEAGEAKDVGAFAPTVANPVRDDLRAYSLGLNVSYAGFTVGGSYGDAPALGMVKGFDSSAHYWTLGGAYEFGPFAASVTYLDSTVEHGTGAGAPDQDFRNISVGADYKLAPGLMPYAEVSFFDSDDNVSNTAGKVDNDGTVVIVGTKLNF